MQLSERKEGNILIVKLLEKRLDAHIAVAFKKKMAEFIDNGNELIVLNLSNVNFIDSSGLGSIVSSLKKLGGKGDLIICCAQENVMSMFHLTRLERVFEIFAGEEEAVIALSS
jgi:anti-sigma B factor antagonist